MIKWVIKRNGKVVLETESNAKQKAFFFNLYFYLLAKCGDDKTCKETIRGNYTLEEVIEQKIFW